MPKSRRGLWIAVIVVVALVVGGGGGSGGYWWWSNRGPGGGDDLLLEGEGAQLANKIFALDPGAKGDGATQTFSDVAAVGETLVAVGVGYGANFTRPLFAVSTDAGKTWRLAELTAADGGDPPLNEHPTYVVGSEEGWVALGRSGFNNAVWTSENGETWTRQPDASDRPFGLHTYVEDLAWTPEGLMAVGYRYPDGDFERQHAVLWTSSDGTTWQRSTPKLPAEGKARELDAIAVRDSTIVAIGSVEGTDYPVPAIWRSTDGGTTWQQTTLPGAEPASPFDTITGGPDGFLAARRDTANSGTVLGVYTSADGRQWSELGKIPLPEDAGFVGGVELVASGSGLAAAVDLDVDKGSVVFTSRDGRSWQQAGTLQAQVSGNGLGIAMTGGTAVVAGGSGKADQDPMIAVAASGGSLSKVNLGAVPDLVHPDRLLADVTTADGLTVAVGSTNAGPAIWTSRDRKTWSRASVATGGAAAGSDPAALSEVLKTESGWLAIGWTVVDSTQPLVLASTDGRTWQPVGSSEALRDADSRQLRPFAAAAGSAGLAIVGVDVGEDFTDSGAAWHADAGIRTWERVEDEDVAGASGAGQRMYDVTAGSFGFVAVGLKSDPSAPPGEGAKPAVWTSGDGVEWSLQTTSLPKGAASANFSTVVSNENTILAIGSASPSDSAQGAAEASDFAFGYQSTDGGKTWTPVTAPAVEDGENVVASDVVDLIASPRGFIAVGTVGSSGGHDVVLWNSPDGRSWQPTQPEGVGLSGPGEQTITAITVAGDQLVGVGYTADYREEYPTLWRTPVP